MIARIKVLGGLDIAQRTAQQQNLSINRLEIDFETDPFPTGPWDVIVGFFFLDRTLFPRFADSLAPGGLLVYSQPTVTNLQRLADGTGGFYASVHDASGLEELYSRVAKSLTEGYVVDTYTCLPNGKPPMSGQKVEGRTTVDGQATDWTVIAP